MDLIKFSQKKRRNWNAHGVIPTIFGEGPKDFYMKFKRGELIKIQIKMGT